MAITGTYRKANPSTKRNIPLEEYYDKKDKKPGLQSIKLGKRKIHLKEIQRYLIYTGIGVVIASLLGLASGYQQHIPCRDIQVQVHAEKDHHFLSDRDIKMLVEMDYGRQLIGEKFQEIDLEAVEGGLEEVPYIQSAEVYKSVTGVLNIQVWMRKPIARVVNNSGSFLYLDAEGHKFPTSFQQAAHVLLIRGDIDEKLMPADTIRKEILRAAIPVLNFIHQNDFWNAQISEVIIQDNGDLILHTQIGDMEIEFGKPDQIAEKFDRLKLFYHQVIQRVGWDHYRFISIKYKHQVIAKK